jgi:hypothetical protein
MSSEGGLRSCSRHFSTYVPFLVLDRKRSGSKQLPDRIKGVVTHSSAKILLEVSKRSEAGSDNGGTAEGGWQSEFRMLGLVVSRRLSACVVWFLVFKGSHVLGAALLVLKNSVAKIDALLVEAVGLSRGWVCSDLLPLVVYIPPKRIYQIFSDDHK